MTKKQSTVTNLSNIGKNPELSEEMEDHVTNVMIQDASDQISSFISIVNLLLADLQVLFDTLNMDNPTKV